ncbi:MAG: adenylate/guanylate cyclase domain-containing protein [Pseudomonadota bacterium]
MKLEKFNEMLLESAGVGLAILRPEDREILMGNRRFEEWFPDVVGAGRQLDDICPDIDFGRLEERLASGREFKCEIAVKVKRRAVTLAMQCSSHMHDDMAVLILECQNISKIKELEYMIESYSKMVEKQNRVLEREKERVEKLLLNIMPKTVYEEMKTFGITTPQKYENASILMLDFVGFTDMDIAADPAGTISELNDIFTAFDTIAAQFGCERLKTIGDAYMAVSGIPEPTPEHATNIAKLAVLMLRYLNRRNDTHKQQWRARIGINSGVVIGSIVGVQKYVYDIFGPGVNLAARMETFSEPMEITLCEDMYDLIRGDFELTERGEFEVKGFGTKRLYNLDGGRGELTLRSEGLFAP